MTPSERLAARKRCEAAAPAPWVVKNLKYVVAPCPCCGQICECDQFGVSDVPECYHSEFIAHARTDLPKALDQIDADERTMRDAVAVLVDLGACDDPECREPNCIHFLPRLRTRLAQEQEADDESE